MTIVGRITRDAVVNSTKDERKVVNFSLAINERYKPKEGEPVKVTTYCNCSYWITEKVAKNLKKGTLVEVTGRIYVTAYAGTDGTAKASFNCHVNNIKIHAWPKEVEAIGKAVQTTAQEENTDDMPF
jgi:single-strand DNA-binding protein